MIFESFGVLAPSFAVCVFVDFLGVFLGVASTTPCTDFGEVADEATYRGRLFISSRVRVLTLRRQLTDLDVDAKTLQWVADIHSIEFVNSLSRLLAYSSRYCFHRAMGSSLSARSNPTHSDISAMVAYNKKPSQIHGWLSDLCPEIPTILESYETSHLIGTHLLTDLLCNLHHYGLAFALDSSEDC